jgi:hypothetical protein
VLQAVAKAELQFPCFTTSHPDPSLEACLAHFQQKSWNDCHDLAIPLPGLIVNRISEIHVHVLPSWPTLRQEAQNCDASSACRSDMTIIVTILAALQLV